MKIALIADCHLGLGYPGPDPMSRFDDIRRVMDWCADKMIEEHVDICLFAGDAFKDSRVMLDRAYLEIAAFSEWLARLSQAGIYTVVISGTPSHDAISAYKILQQIFADDKNVAIVTEPRNIEFDSINVSCLPGISRSTLCASEEFQGKSPQEIHAVMSEKLVNITQGMRACAPEDGQIFADILLTHFTYSEADTGFDHLLMEHEPLLTPAAVDGFGLVCLGHIHGGQKIPGKPIFYAGSPERLSFNEEFDDKGFWIHETDNDYFDGIINSYFVETPARVFLTLDGSDIEDVSGAIVRVKIENDEGATDRREIEKRLYAAGAFFVQEINIKTERIDRARDEEVTESLTPILALEKWAVQQGIAEDEAAALKEMTFSLMEVAS